MVKNLSGKKTSKAAVSKSFIHCLPSENGESFIGVDTIPEDIYSLQKMSFLHISFLNDIIIPAEQTKIKITNLELNGHITWGGEERIKKMFPDTKLMINRDKK